MPSNPNIPDAFDVYTVVVLRRPADAPEMPDDELDALQARHLAYRAGLAQQGLIVVNGPFDEQSAPSYRGMSIFACDPAEAARWYALAAAQNHPLAQFNLGTLHANGTGVPQDLAKANELFESANENNMFGESNTSCTTQRSAQMLEQCRRVVPLQ